MLFAERMNVMNNLIERYVYDVIRRLPEKEQEEVRRELESNIYDMLSDQANENEIKNVLYELGSPASLAEKYRSKPRYLISPAIYDAYIRVVKWVVPLIGVVVMAIGMIVGAIDSIKGGVSDTCNVITNIISSGISSGFSAALQALFWTTFGFSISERFNNKTGKDGVWEWKVEDLPEALPKDKHKIPLSDSITELVITVVFSVIGIFLCSGMLPIAFSLQNNNIRILNIFTSSFLATCIPVILITAFFCICTCTIKIIYRHWTPLVCGFVIANSLVSAGATLYLFTRPNIVSQEFLTFIDEKNWGSLDLLHFMGERVANPIPIIICTLIVVCTLAECGKAIYKTMKARE